MQELYLEHFCTFSPGLDCKFPEGEDHTDHPSVDSVPSTHWALQE